MSGKNSPCKEHNEISLLLQQPHGVSFLQKLLQMTGVWSASYVHKDSLASAYNEGKRSVGLYILQQVQVHSPQAIDDLLGWSALSRQKPQRLNEGETDE